MSTRQIALAGTLLALVFLAHAAARFTQIGGAQLAPSIAVYALMALLLANQLAWGPLVGIGLLCGVLTMLATSSPFPPANIAAHGLGFLTAAFLAKRLAPGGRDLSVGAIVAVMIITTFVSWTLFAVVTWLGLSGSPFAQQSWSRFGADFGTGLLAWWISGGLGIGVPTAVIGCILTPLLYRAVRPALIRQGMLAAEPAAA